MKVSPYEVWAWYVEEIEGQVDIYISAESVEIYGNGKDFEFAGGLSPAGAEALAWKLLACARKAKRTLKEYGGGNDT